MPPEERLSLNSGPPEVSVVLPTGQGRGWVTETSPEDSKVCCVMTGRGQNQRSTSACWSQPRGGPYFPLTRKTLLPCLPSYHPPFMLSHPHLTNLKILRGQNLAIKQELCKTKERTVLETEPITSDSKNAQHHRVTGTLASQSGTDMRHSLTP